MGGRRSSQRPGSGLCQPGPRKPLHAGYLPTSADSPRPASAPSRSARAVHTACSIRCASPSRRPSFSRASTSRRSRVRSRRTDLRLHGKDGDLLRTSRALRRGRRSRHEARPATRRLRQDRRGAHRPRTPGPSRHRFDGVLRRRRLLLRSHARAIPAPKCLERPRDAVVCACATETLARATRAAARLAPVCARTVDVRAPMSAIRCRPTEVRDVEAIAALHADSWRRNYRGAYLDSYLDGDVVTDRLRVWANGSRAPNSFTEGRRAGRRAGETAGGAKAKYRIVRPTWTRRITRRYPLAKVNDAFTA